MNLNKETKQVIDKAKQLAKALHHQFAGSEHLLISLLSTSKSVQDMLSSVDLDSEHLHKMSLDILKDTRMAPGKHDKKVEVTLSPRANRVITMAANFATEIGAKDINAVCVFLGILDELSGMCTYLFEQMNINTESLRHVIGDMLGVDSEPSRKFKMKPSSEPPQTMPPPTMYGAPQNQQSGDDEEDPLEQFTVNLTYKALHSELPEVIGREQEIDRIIEVLTRKTKNNPMLVGEPGVGKTAIIEGLAQRIITNDVPDSLLHKKILQLDINALVAGTIYRGQFEERLKTLIEVLKMSPECILFIDEIHNVMGAGAASNSMDMSNIIKPELARGEISCIGITTTNKYIETIQPEGAFNRRFQKINVDEPTHDDTLAILLGVKESYETHHRVKYNKQAVKEIIALCHRYQPEKRFPDKALDVMDELGARERYKLFKDFFFINPEMEKAMLDVVSRKESAMHNKDTALMALVEQEEKAINQELNLAINAWMKVEKKMVRVDKPIVCEYFSSITKIPVTSLEQDEAHKLVDLERVVKRVVVGQDDAVHSMCQTVKRARLGLNSANRPVGVFLFLGPTGVGKTHSARILNEQLFGTQDNMIQVNMSEMMEEHSISKMIGSPPGYVGYDNDNSDSFTNRVRENPYSVVLFDEMEKAHPSILQIFLQIFEEGYCKDSKGRKVDFSNTYIIMTSNIGSAAIQHNNTVGFGTFNVDQQVEQEDKIKKELSKHLAPELLNRIDDIVIFQPLKPDVLSRIAKLEIQHIKRSIKKKLGVALHVEPEVIDWIVDESYEEKYGARPVKRYIHKTLVNHIADTYLQHTTCKRVTLQIENGELSTSCE
jgi:ATP-dependent Clp protease ATP-binding subunit ClpC